MHVDFANALHGRGSRCKGHATHATRATSKWTADAFRHADAFRLRRTVIRTHCGQQDVPSSSVSRTFDLQPSRRRALCIRLSMAAKAGTAEPPLSARLWYQYCCDQPRKGSAVGYLQFSASFCKTTLESWLEGEQLNRTGHQECTCSQGRNAGHALRGHPDSLPLLRESCMTPTVATIASKLQQFLHSSQCATM